jgi:5-methylcytosine-specific restriction endonuclease McrA
MARNTKQLREHRHTLFSLQNGRCFYCQTDCQLNDKNRPRSASVDHKQTMADRGSGKLENLVMACRSCNNLRGNIAYEDFLEGQLWLPEHKEERVRLTVYYNRGKDRYLSPDCQLVDFIMGSKIHRI